MLEVARLFAVYDADTRGFDKKSKDVEDTLGKLSSGAGVFGGFVGAQIFMEAAQSLGGLAAEGVTAYASFERLGMSLQSLSAREAISSGAANNMSAALAMSSGKASELVGWIQELAVKSPFSREGVSAAFRQAMAYGFASDEAQRLTQAMIDFAAGSGASEGAMNQIALALGQIQAKGKLSGQEILQLVNAGIPVQQVLAKAFGKSTAEISKMTEQGLIPANAAIEAIVQSLEQDFGGAAARQAETVAGLMNSLSDLKDVNLTAFFGGFFEEVQPYLAEFVDSLSDPAMQENLAELGRNAGELVVTLVEGGREILSIWESMPDWMQNVTVALVGMEMATPPLIDGLGKAAVSLNNWGGALKSLPGFYRDVQAAQALLKEGAGVFSVMSTGAAGVTATLGPLAIALAAVTAVAVTYNETIGKAQNEGMENATEAWAGALGDVAASGASSEAVLKIYAEAVERVNKAHEDGGWIADAFVDKNAILYGGLNETITALSQTAGSYEEYSQAARQAADAAGFVVDSQGRMYEVTKNGLVATRKFVGSLNLVSKAEFLAADAAANASEYFDGHTASMMKTNAALIDFGKAALDAGDISKMLSASMKEFGVNEIIVSAMTDDLAVAMGELDPVMRQLQDDARLYSDALALGLVDQSEYTIAMQAAKDGTLALDEARRAELQTAVNGAIANRENAQAAAEAAASFWGLAESLKGASEAEFAKQMLGQLGELLKTDTPNVALYNQAYQELALQYGFATEGSMAMAAALPTLFKILEDGRIAPENLSAAMSYLYQDAQDGAVNWETFSQKFNITEPFATTQGALDETGAAAVGFGEDVTATTAVIDTELPKWVEAAKSVSDAIAEAFTGEDWAGVGLAISEGVAAGLATGAAKVEAAARIAAQAAYNAAKTELEIHSPSAKFAYLGEMALKGFEMPFLQNDYAPVQASLDKSAAMPATPGTQYSGVAGAVELSDASILRLAQVLAHEMAVAGVGQ